LDEIRTTLVDHVLVHGMTMKEAGQRVQPNLSRFTITSIIRTFREKKHCETGVDQGCKMILPLLPG